MNRTLLPGFQSGSCTYTAKGKSEKEQIINNSSGISVYEVVENAAHLSDLIVGRVIFSLRLCGDIRPIADVRRL